MKTLKIEMIHDVVCSWCHIGYHNLSRALETLQGNIVAEIQYLPFQLNPGLSTAGVDIVTHLRARNHWTEQQAADYRRDLLATAARLGVTIDFDRRTRYFNTERAHRLLFLAQEAGRPREMHRALLHAYHVRGVNIDDPQALRKLADGVGLDGARAITALYSDRVNAHMQRAANRISQYAVGTVPAFIFNDTGFVSGSNDPGFFENLIRTQYSVPARNQRETGSCPT